MPRCGEAGISRGHIAGEEKESKEANGQAWA